MAVSSSFLALSFFLFLFLFTLSPLPVSATDHIVGANRGWNPGINYTLWAKNHTFYVGDFISFRYPKNQQYNVFEVNQTGYDNCTIESAVGNWSSGKDFILLNKSMRYYFICGNGQCSNGMKVTVFVYPLPSPPSSSEHHHSSPNAAAPMVLEYLGHKSLMLSFVFVLFGYVLV